MPSHFTNIGGATAGTFIKNVGAGVSGSALSVSSEAPGTEQEAFAFMWSRPAGGTNHFANMHHSEKTGVNPAPADFSAYGTVVDSAGTPSSSALTHLGNMPTARRSYTINWTHTWMYRHRDCRCDDGTVDSFTHISTKPRWGSNSSYRNILGEDANTNVASWATSTAYSVGDQVKNDDVIFECISAHTSGDTDDEPGVGATEATYWAAPSAHSEASVVYAQWDCVTKAGVVYICTTGHTSSASNDPPNITYWDGAYSGFSSVWHEPWKTMAAAWSSDVVGTIVAAGHSLVYLIFDHEQKIDEFKLTSDWRTHLKNDSHWAVAKARLDVLSQARAGVDFDDTANWALNDNKYDWDAYMWEQAADSVNVGIFNVFQAQWPSLKGSNYEFHGRAVSFPSVDLNANPYYQTSVIGTHSCDYLYGWRGSSLPNADITGLRTEGISGWHIFMHERHKVHASLDAGWNQLNWCSFSSFDDGDWEQMTDESPIPHTYDEYWRENAIHTILEGEGVALCWQSRTYRNQGVQKEEWKGEWVTSTAYVADECVWNNDGATNDRYICDSNHTSGASTEPGVGGSWATVWTLNNAVHMSTDEVDQYMQTILDDINTQIGTTGPRTIINTGKVGWNEPGGVSAGDPNYLPTGSGYSVSHLRAGTQSVCRFTVQRHLQAQDDTSWPAISNITVLKDGADSGHTVTIPAGEAGVWYTTTHVGGEAITLDYTHATITNLIADSNSFETANWSDGGITWTTSKSDPLGGSAASGAATAGLVYFQTVPITVVAETTYTLSIYIQTTGGGSGGSGTRLEMWDSADTSAQYTDNWGNWTGWQRKSLTFTTAVGETSLIAKVRVNDADVYAVQLNIGIDVTPVQIT